MVLFLLAAGLILAYGAAYGIFCAKKGGLGAALLVCFLLTADLLLLASLCFFRINT